jgi:multiple sugar transport system permease protein
MRREALAGYMFVGPAVFGFLAFAAFPLILAFYYSFTDFNMLTASHWVGLRNYSDLFTNEPYLGTAVVNTLYYTLLVVPLGIVCGLALAILLNQKIPAMSIFRTLYYLPSIMPTVAASVLWIWLFDPNSGLLNMMLGWFGVRGPYWLADPNWSKPALVIMSLWGVGGSMVLYLAGLQGVPQELYDAADIDGANRWRRFRHITVPMISGVLFFTLVTGFIGAFQVFTQAYIMTGGGPLFSTYFYMLMLYHYAFMNFQMGYASAMALVLFVVILALTIVVFKTLGSRVYTELGKGR